MDVGQRQVPPDITEIADIGEQLPNDRLRLTAERALEVAVFDERHFRLVRPADVVALRIHRNRKVDELIRGAEERADPQLDRELCGGPEQNPGRRGRDDRGGEHPELRLGERRPREREVGDQQRHGEPDPGDEPAARHAAQPTGGRRRPRLSFVTSQEPPVIPIGFPAT